MGGDEPEDTDPEELEAGVFKTRLADLKMMTDELAERIKKYPAIELSPDAADEFLRLASKDSKTFSDLRDERLGIKRRDFWDED